MAGNHEKSFNNGELRRVLMVSESSLEHTNGVTRSAKEVLKGLREHGYEAEVITPSPLPDERTYAGYPVKSVVSFPFQEFQVGLPAHGTIRRMVKTFQPDIIHNASPVWRLGSATEKAANHLGIASVAIYQTDVAQYADRFAKDNIDRAFGQEAKWLRKSAGETLESVFARRIANIHSRATLNLVPSNPAWQRLEKFGVDPSTMRMWGRGVDTELFDTNRRNLEQVIAQHDLWSQGGRLPVIGYVGRLAPEKRVERLEALQDHAAQVVIVGEGPMENELKRRLGSSAIFTGKLTGEQLANAYASFDMFVHTGTEETFGQTIQEAMASGLAVVAPASGGPLDIVRNGETGLLYSPESDSQMSQNVTALIESVGLREQMGEAGRKIVSERTWGKVVSNLLSYYDEAYTLNSNVQIERKEKVHL